jgi:hypothetical protein
MYVGLVAFLAKKFFIGQKTPQPYVCRVGGVFSQNFFYWAENTSTLCMSGWWLFLPEIFFIRQKTPQPYVCRV